LARKKKKDEELEKEEVTKEEDAKEPIGGHLIDDYEEDFEDDLDLEEELELLDTEDLDADIEEPEKIIDKDEEKKQLYLSICLQAD